MSNDLFENPIEVRTLAEVGNVQRIYEFSNGWGASVVRGPFTYGGPQGFWALAVTEGAKGRLSYDTPITNDVVGWLSEAEVEAVLARVAELPERNGEEGR